ncbi:TIGR04282 family arsenosugar biosynthesis glycosyltransferase [Amycolatopsis pithecellobii]|uniref:DUF2064 domain-containing protein n=1 Tax=Amycolatopsis pithecellobii TaxID=664692 RepID=A0A6N7Z816_9PSEU|nr:DUF2064 domain-containing protein [Amycolatopsis pithecellobii]MTD57624.1 DUF2064 domain-containing protein [Amycolatopsis pithecellobii]
MKRIVLVVAKAPVPGRVKTRLTPAVTARQAATIAAAALLDTVDTALATPGAEVAVALHGDLRDAVHGGELAELLGACEVFPQRGNDFPARLANAHADLAARHAEARTVQIGMDTPQVTTGLLAGALDRLDAYHAVLGHAQDGGWWCLGLRDPRAAGALRAVPTSRADTGARTATALARRGHTVGTLPEMSDVDTLADAHRVATLIPGSRFAAAVTEVSR